MEPLEPIPQTAAYIAEFGKLYDVDLLKELRGRAEAVRTLVPDLVGVTVASVEDGVAFTLVASEETVAILDAIQYVVGGPCVEAAPGERVVEYRSDELLDEYGWRDFAEASAAKGVASTLTLPILDRGGVVGTVNLYAASRRAFEGLHREIADVFGGWAPGAVTNADLGFRSRRNAEAAPSRMRMEIAVRMLIEAKSLDEGEARELLRQAAQRAGVDPEQLAKTLLEVNQSSDDV